jgi:hypothetical protein
MRGKLFLGLIASVLIMFTVAGAYAEQLQKISPNNAGFTIMPLTNGDPSGPPLLDPTVPAPGPAAVAAVPEPSTIAMLFLGSGCAGAFTVLRRRRRS